MRFQAPRQLFTFGSDQNPTLGSAKWSSDITSVRRLEHATSMMIQAFQRCFSCPEDTAKFVGLSALDE